METKHIHIKDYNYALPDERIAKFPLAQRDRSKLLLYKHGEVSEDVFCNIADHLPKGALMVFNNTRVIQARMHFRKATGALIEVFLLEPYAPADYEQMFQTKGECEWLCMIGNLKKWKGETLERTFDVNGEAVTLKAERRCGRVAYSAVLEPRDAGERQDDISDRLLEGKGIGGCSDSWSALYAGGAGGY